ncbi:MAG: Gfo/Idh/MocA family oxidoreductase, partial [Thermoanaerobaculia bacterium]|nr:Gfo/Idh/MocA family oxidoreductase [Thermoanaerobaculia bacterium]
MERSRVRYAVVGLGHIAQVAVIPAFENASENSELVALVSGDEDKLKALGERHDVPLRRSYEDYDALLESGDIDAVYIALPNSMHRDYAVRAAEAGVHVLCEKPMAVTSAECREMLDAADENDVRLMIAYRLHFEEANLKAAEIVASEIGNPRIFSSVFTMSVKEGDVRLKKELGGGPLYDIGIYCINAARYLFRDEPLSVSAIAASPDDSRFAEVPETVAVSMRFPGDRLASFTASFGSAGTGSYRVIGTDGDLQLEPAYGYAVEMEHRLTVGGDTTRTKFDRRDQFAPELIHFSKSVLEGTDPGPSGLE